MRYDKIVYYRFNDSEKKGLLGRLRASLAGNPRVVLAYAFGSFIRRESFRDVDVAIYAVPPLSFDELLNLCSELELELGIPIDAAQLQDLNPTFRYRVLKRGLQLVARDGHLPHRLMAQSLSERQDSVALRKAHSGE